MRAPALAAAVLPALLALLAVPPASADGLPPPLRDDCLYVHSGNQVLWVCYHRDSNHWCVEHNSQGVTCTGLDRLVPLDPDATADFVFCLAGLPSWPPPVPPPVCTPPVHQD